MRREGASRLLEWGFAIEEVAQVTRHRNLQTLWNIYISLFPNSLHAKFNKLQKRRKLALFSSNDEITGECYIINSDDDHNYVLYQTLKSQYDIADFVMLADAVEYCRLKIDSVLLMH
nr:MULTISPECIES: hypothetical protein [unclassified Gilliamella]